MVRIHLLFTAIALGVSVSCASQPQTQLPQPMLSCDSIPEVPDYLDRVALRISDIWLDLHEAPASASARVSFRFDENGEIIEATVTKASSPEARSKAQRALELASPLPTPPFDPHGCLIRRRQSLALIADMKLDCDVPPVAEYTEEIATRVYTRLDERPYRYQPGKGRVGLSITLSPDGTAAEIEVVRADSDVAAEKAIAVVEELSPFPQPPAAYAACFSEHAVRISVKVIGY